MKKMLAYAGIALLFLAACQKNDESAAVRESKKLTTATAKEWYYGTFKKGPEWQRSAQKGKKLPDWKNGIISRFGDYEVADFPLLKQQFKVPLFTNTTLNEENKKRVAGAAVHRIVFFRDKKGDIAVRQLTFVPDFDYLRQKGFDISGNTFGNIDDNYSGLLVVQQWNEQYVAISRIKNGKVINRYKAAKAGISTEAEGGCNGTLVIEYERYCEVTISSDGIVTEECGAWMPTGNQWCFEDDPGGGDPCADPESPQCACAGYGLCDTGGGGDEPPACGNISCEEVANRLSSVVTTFVSDGGFSSTAEIGPDPNGITRKPVIVNIDGVTNNYFWGYSDRWALFFNGMLFKTQNSSVWKWESITYDKIAKVSGTIPLCVTNTTTASISGPVISSNKLTATYSGSISTTLSSPCFFGIESDTRTTPSSNTYHSSWF